MTTVQLHNGDKLLLVEVPEDAQNFSVTLDGLTYDRYFNYDEQGSRGGYWFEDCKVGDFEGMKILGIYSKGEIDFEAKDEYVESDMESWYKDYVYNGFIKRFTVQESFLSLLSSEIKKSGSNGSKFVILLSAKK